MPPKIIDLDRDSVMRADLERRCQASSLAESEMGPRPEYDGVMPDSYEMFLFHRYERIYQAIAQKILRRIN